MKKIKLYGIGNQEDFNYYILDKKQEVAEKIAEILKQVLNLDLKFVKEYKNKKLGVWIFKKINIEKNKDIHNSVNKMGHNERIDIFYGDKKMFITLYCSKEKRLKFNEDLFKIVYMPKSKKLTDRKNEKNKSKKI